MDINIKKSNYVRSIVKAFIILEQFSNNTQEKGIHELSTATSLPVSTVQRLVNTLQYKGYLIQNPKNSKYRLGLALYNLSKNLSHDLHWVEDAKQYMISLVSKHEETVNLAVLEEEKIVYLTKIDSPHILRPSFKIGTKYPAYCTGLGRCLLAYMPVGLLNEILIEPLEPYTRNTITDIAILEKELKKIREQGFAIDDEEFQEGLRCIASPLKNYNMGGIVVAAMSVTGPTARMSFEKIEKIKNDLLKATNNISRLIT